MSASRRCPLATSALARVNDASPRRGSDGGAASDDGEKRVPALIVPGCGGKPAERNHGDDHHRDGRQARNRTSAAAGRVRRSRARRAARSDCRRRRDHRFEAIEPIEDRQRFFWWRAAFDGRLEQPPRLVGVAAIEGGHAGLQQFFGFALALGEGAPRPFDIGARPRVTAIEKQRARPDVDGQLVARREVVIETDEKELLDFRVAIRSRSRSGIVGVRVAAMGVGH
jgi:hypothetical protein